MYRCGGDRLGYTTAFFGKVLNTMTSYGCDGTSGLPPGLDHQITMCTHTFFDCDWVNSSAPMGEQLFHTGNTTTPGCENGECYTTSERSPPPPPPPPPP
eukprot:COSAG04_NODE_1305_length_7299_cov_19.161389_3_plen_99_part_00